MDVLPFDQTLPSFPSKVLFLEATVIVGLSYFSSTSKKKVPRDPKLPPQLTSKSWTEYMKIMNSTSGPQSLLDTVRESGEADYEIPKLPLGLPPFFFLSDYRSARKALEDMHSTKWEPADQFFKRTTHNGLNVIIKYR